MHFTEPVYRNPYWPTWPLLEEVLLFVENLTCDCSFITHHTIGGTNLTGPDFLGRKDQIVAALRNEIDHGDLDRMARIRSMRRSL